MSTSIKIEMPTKDNYDSWSMQVEALMTKNGTWKYMSGKLPVADDAAFQKWLQNDKQAKSDLILSISPSKLQQVRGCDTSSKIWQKLQGIYASKGKPLY